MPLGGRDRSTSPEDVTPSTSNCGAGKLLAHLCYALGTVGMPESVICCLPLLSIRLFPKGKEVCPQPSLMFFFIPHGQVILRCIRKLFIDLLCCLGKIDKQCNFLLFF